MSGERKRTFPLPRRFNAAVSEKAYAKLRELNGEYGFSNNYVLTFLLENLDQIAKQRELRRVFDRMVREYGGPEV